MKQVDRYAAVAAAEKPTFLDRQIDEVQQSGVVQALSAVVEEKRASQPTSLWSSLTQRIARWTARMEPQRKAKVEQFVAAVQGNLLWRSLRANWLTPAQEHPGS